MPAAYGAYGIWKRDAEADSEAKPWWNTYASAYGWNGMYNGWYNRPYAYGLWKRDAEADSEAKPWWNTYAGAYGWNGMYNGWYNRPYAYGLWKRDAEADSRPSPGGTPMDGTACTTTGTTCLLPMVPMESGRGTLRLIPRQSPGGTPMDGTACTTAGTAGTTGPPSMDC